MWLDTWGQDGWKIPKRVKCHPKHVHTLGWVVKETSDAIAVALDHCVDDNDYNGWSIIPKVCIVSRVRLQTIPQIPASWPTERRVFRPGPTTWTEPLPLPHPHIAPTSITTTFAGNLEVPPSLD